MTFAHRLFSFITMNWRSKPLVSYETIVKLISSTKTDRGSTVHCDLDEDQYENGRAISNTEIAAIRLYPNEFHGEWNYTIVPRRPKRTIGVKRVVDRVVS